MEKIKKVCLEAFKEANADTTLIFEEGDRNKDSAGTYDREKHSIIIRFKPLMKLKEEVEEKLGKEVDIVNVARFVLFHEIGHSKDPNLIFHSEKIDEYNELSSISLYKKCNVDDYIHHINNAGRYLLKKEVYAWEFAKKWKNDTNKDIFYTLMIHCLRTYQKHVRDVRFNGVYSYHIISIIEDLGKIDKDIKKTNFLFEDKGYTSLYHDKKNGKMEVNVNLLMKKISQSELSLREYFTFHLYLAFYKHYFKFEELKVKEIELFEKSIEHACEKTYQKYIDIKMQRAKLTFDVILFKTKSKVSSLLGNEALKKYEEFIQEETIGEIKESIDFYWERFHRHKRKEITNIA